MSTPAETTKTSDPVPAVVYQKKPKNPEAVIPVDEVKKEDTKGDKRGHGKTNKGPNSQPEKTDRKDQPGQKPRNRPTTGKKSEGAYIRKAVADGETPAEDVPAVEGEEKKKDRKPRYERPERVSAFSWDKFAVTLETPIPVKPTEKEKLVEPKRENLDKALEAASKKIEAAKNKKKALVISILSKDKSVVVNANEKGDPLHEELKKLNEVLKVVSPVNEEAQAELKVKQDQVNVLKKREEELKAKMKVVQPADKIIEQLEDLRYRQSNEKLKPQEEKKIVQEIELLEISLPLAVPLQKVTQERRALEDSMKGLKERSSKSYKQVKELRVKIKGIREELDRLKKLKEEMHTSTNPEIETINENFVIELAALKKERNDLYEKFDNDRKAYNDQQEVFRYIDFVKRQHEFLRKREVQKKRDEDRKKREVEEIAYQEEKKKSKYVIYVETADFLIAYLEKLSGKGDKKDFLEAGEVEQPVEVKKELKADDLKAIQKEKLTVLVSRKDRADLNSGTAAGKKGKQQQQQQKPQQEKAGKPAVDAGFMHSYETMQQFEKLTVSPPTYKDEIEKTVALLQEKKQYYIDLPNKEGGATESTPAEGESKQEKKGKKNQNKIEFDESSFPTIDN